MELVLPREVLEDNVTADPVNPDAIVTLLRERLAIDMDEVLAEVKTQLKEKFNATRKVQDYQRNAGAVRRPRNGKKA
jgi:hypothetical protein